jgi:phospholipid/cholesterol/gamma-HCH transport system permease protein
MRITTRIANAIRFGAGFLGRSWTYLINRILDWSSGLLSICALFYCLLLSSFSSLTGFRLIWRQLIRQVYFSGIQGMHVLIISAIMLGFLVIVYATPKLALLQGEEFVGWLLVTIVVREVGPLWAAFFVLLHSGSAITVEIGTMSVNREVEALKLLGIDPHRFLGVPRFWAVTISVVSLYVLCCFAAILGGFFYAQIFTEIFWNLFWYSFLNSLEWLDVALGFSKCISFGMLIATVCIFFGLQPRKDMDEVARFTSEASIVALVLVALVDILLTTAYYL